MPLAFRCRCTPIRSNQRRNWRSSAPASRPAAQRCAPELARPPDHALVRPFDVAVPQQRHEVVGERAVHGVLEVEDARVVPVADHQVARVVVAVHEHARLRERVRDQEVECCRRARRCPHRPAPGRGADRAASPGTGSSRSAAASRRRAAAAPRARRRRAWIAQQRVDRVRVQRSGAVALVKPGEIGDGTEVREQQEALFAFRASTRGAFTPMSASMPATAR